MPKRGENIYKRKDGRWEGRYIKNTYNSKKYGYVYGHSYKEVKEKLFIAKTDITNPLEKILTLSAISDNWLSHISNNVKESTYAKYYNIVEKHIKPNIGQTRIADFENKTVNILLINIADLAPKTVKDILMVLDCIVKYANKMFSTKISIDFNDFIPRQPPKKIKVLTVAERLRLEKYLLGGDLPKIGVLLALYTGVRIGELCALRWRDIDTKNGIIKINSTIQRIQDFKQMTNKKTKLIITEPKSISSKREIPLTDFLNAIIKNVYNSNPNAFFITGTEKPVEPRTMENKFKKYLKECEIENINFHALRHTFSTMCIELAFETKSLSEILGHSSVSTTLNLYAHPSIEYKRQNMKKLEFAV